MRRRLTSAGIIIAVALTVGCAKAPPTEDEVYTELRAAFSESEDPAEKLDIARSFLAQFPEGDRAPRVLDAAVAILEDDMEDGSQALGLVEQALAGVTDPESRFRMKATLWRLAREHGEPFSLREVAAELDGHRELGYGDLHELMELAVKAEEWSLAEQWADAGLAFASAEAYRADYPDRDYSDELIAHRAANRLTYSLGHKAWAAYQQGRVEEAMDLFAEGEGEMNFSYVGAPETPLYKFWGRAHFNQGELDRAAELVEADAVMGGSDFAMDTLKEVFVARTGSEDGVDAFLRETRERLSRIVDDFTLPTYSGSDFQLSSTLNKVVLLNFWFPT